jgi:thiol-disulfide isomerase/thioredoxin
VVPKVDFPADGPYVAIAILKGKNGLEASRVPSPTVGANPRIPEDGQRPPAITTLTAADVGGDLEKIDTRVPPDQMHKWDFADVLGKQPIVLIFATPALCQSRVCGPVVDVAQQVADQYEKSGKADFIHQEVYVDNEIAKGIRPQLKEFGLETEPWTFLIGKDGKVVDRIEGAYGVAELEAAMKKIVPG